VPVYAYKGVAPSGRNTRGTVSADSIRSARAKLRGDGVFLTEIAETNAPAAKPGEAGSRRFEINLPVRIPPMERAVATRQLATLVSAGIPLVEALSALVTQIDHAALKGIMSTVRDKVNEGSTLADALQSTGKFDTLYVSMVKAGEAGGRLDMVLLRIADYLEESVRMSSRLTSVMVYPAAMLTFAFLVVGVLVTFILPQITGLLASMGAELPAITRWIIAVSDFATEWWWAILIFVVGSIITFRRIVATAAGGAAFDRIMLRLPIIGRITRFVAISRFARTLGSLLGSGVNIIQAMDIARHVANNSVIGKVIDGAKTAVIEGSSLAAPLRKSGEFPAMVVTMIEVGERAGELASMLDRVAETYDEQVETTVQRLTSLLEPALILVMVGVVMIIVLAVLMPLMELTNTLN
jgi:general secretion pathway protein F